MAIPPRRWVGYALSAAGLSFLFDTLTFLQTNWSPLKVPMYAANELAIGCLLIVAAVLMLLAPTLKRTLLRIRIGVALILIAAAIYGGWKWWMATRTWVPLEMPVSLAPGHVRSREFKINLDAGFWIFVEVETKVDDEGVSCLTGYTSDYCRKNGVRELRASWTLSDRGRVVARGSTDSDQGSRGGMLSKARGLGNFSVPAGDHFVLDIEFPEDNSHFNGGHPRLTIAQSYYWSFEENRTPTFLFAMFLGAIGTALFVSGIVDSTIAKRNEQRVSLTSPGPIAGGFQWGAELATEKSHPERRPLLRARALIGLGLAIVGLTSLVIVKDGLIRASSCRWISLSPSRQATFEQVRSGSMLNRDIQSGSTSIKGPTSIRCARRIPCSRPLGLCIEMGGSTRNGMRRFCRMATSRVSMLRRGSMIWTYTSSPTLVASLRIVHG